MGTTLRMGEPPVTDHGAPTALADILADLRHTAAALGLDYDDADGRAARFYADDLDAEEDNL